MVILSLSLSALWGCASIGPHTVARDRFDYTGAIGDSWKQQMLLNVVKARYGDTPIFIDVASVISQYSLETGVNVNGQVVKKEGFGDQFIGMGAHGTFTDRPTITYTPLSGEKFARSLMSDLERVSRYRMGRIKGKRALSLRTLDILGAGDGIRTRDLQLGKLTLYH